MLIEILVVGGATACVLELVGDVPRVARTVVAIVQSTLLIGLWLWGQVPVPGLVAAALASAFLGISMFELLGKIENAVTIVRNEGRGRIPRV